MCVCEEVCIWGQYQTPKNCRQYWFITKMLVDKVEFIYSAYLTNSLFQEMSWNFTKSGNVFEKIHLEQKKPVNKYSCT